MPKLKNYYKILDLSAFADADAVKSAYRKMARQFHPDLNPGNKDHEEKFKLINEAYETLGSNDKKALYDESLRVLLGKDAPHRNPQPKAPENGRNTGRPAEKETSTPINDLFESFIRKSQSPPPKQEKPQQKAPPPKASHQPHQGEEPIFKTGPKEGKSGSSAGGTPKRGQDVPLDTVISPMEAQNGVVKTINVQHNDLCSRCSGTGKVSGSPCTACHGEKVLTRVKKMDVRIPANVKQGSKVRVAGEGGRGQNGGENGDLFLLIKIAVDASLRIEGMDVHAEVPISIPDAVLGRDIDVPTLHGTMKLSVPPMTSSGRVLRLKDQGVHNGQLKGDHFVTVRLVAPQNLTAEEKALYEKLARLQQQKGQ